MRQMSTADTRTELPRWGARSGGTGSEDSVAPPVLASGVDALERGAVWEKMCGMHSRSLCSRGWLGCERAAASQLFWQCHVGINTSPDYLGWQLASNICALSKIQQSVLMVEIIWLVNFQLLESKSWKYFIFYCLGIVDRNKKDITLAVWIFWQTIKTKAKQCRNDKLPLPAALFYRIM